LQRNYYRILAKSKGLQRTVTKYCTGEWQNLSDNSYMMLTNIKVCRGAVTKYERRAKVCRETVNKKEILVKARLFRGTVPKHWRIAEVCRKTVTNAKEMFKNTGE
jgi:hypothetical protein